MRSSQALNNRTKFNVSSVNSDTLSSSAVVANSRPAARPYFHREAMMSFSSCFSSKLTNLLTLILTCALQLYPVEGQSDDLKLSALCMANGSRVCASDPPIETLQSKSKLDCTRTCKSRKNPLCTGINYRESGKQCDIFSGVVYNYGLSEKCQHIQVPTVAKCPAYASSSPVLCLASGAGFIAPVRSLNGWIIIQEASNLNFEWSRPWADYKAGFGQLGSDYWFGLEKIHQMTAASAKKFRFEVRQTPPASQTMLWLEMASFSVGSEMTYYKLAWSGMTGSTEMTSRESSTYHNGMVFSTYDNNYNTMDTYNCPNLQGGAWWFNNCASICATCVLNRYACGSRIGFTVAWSGVCANFTRVMIQAI